MSFGYIDRDLVDIWQSHGRKEHMVTLGWGDEVKVIRRDDGARRIEVEAAGFDEHEDGSILPARRTGFIELPKSSKLRLDDVVVPERRVLQVDFADVQQGDGTLIETPKGRTMIVDAGKNQLFARYLAGRHPGTSREKPKVIDCMLVTHGDDDHLAGFSEILKSEKNAEARKRIFVEPRRVYHNGLVKRPGQLNGKPCPDIQLFGETVSAGDDLIITGLEKNILTLPRDRMNTNFVEWQTALRAWNDRRKLELRRLSAGDDEAFAFLKPEEIDVQVHGPMTTRAGGKEGLRFFRSSGSGSGSFSASHTVNGHSIVFSLRYGSWSFLFTGDANAEAQAALCEDHYKGRINLTAEVLKVPHHGEGKYSVEFLRAVAPVISVVSSGDENARSEYIHPRANLLGGLGKYSRIDQPLIFVTELVAFFQSIGKATPVARKKPESFFAFQRTAFGVVRVRTDGRRLLVYTNSGQAKLKEAYAFEKDAGRVRPVEIVRV